MGDFYYELKDDGFYSPKLYEGYVARPVFELAASIGIDLDFKLLGVYQVKANHKLNFLKWNLAF